jgi:hypothetical protein
VITVVACSLLSFFLADRFAFDPVTQTVSLQTASTDTLSVDSTPRAS